MPGLQVAVDQKAFTLNTNDEYEIRISETPNNGISLTEDGKLLVAATGDDGVNYPGNGILGTSGVALQTIQCDSSVTRINLTETTPSLQAHEGFYMTPIFKAIIQLAANP